MPGSRPGMTIRVTANGTWYSALPEQKGFQRDRVRGSPPDHIGPYVTVHIEGFEAIQTIRKRRCLMLESGAAGEVRCVNRLFRLAA